MMCYTASSPGLHCKWKCRFREGYTGDVAQSRQRSGKCTDSCRSSPAAFQGDGTQNNVQQESGYFGDHPGLLKCRYARLKDQSQGAGQQKGIHQVRCHSHPAQCQQLRSGNHPQASYTKAGCRDNDAGYVNLLQKEIAAEKFQSHQFSLAVARPSSCLICCRT